MLMLILMLMLKIVMATTTTPTNLTCMSQFDTNSINAVLNTESEYIMHCKYTEMHMYVSTRELLHDTREHPLGREEGGGGGGGGGIDWLFQSAYGILRLSSISSLHFGVGFSGLSPD